MNDRSRIGAGSAVLDCEAVGIGSCGPGELLPQTDGRHTVDRPRHVGAGELARGQTELRRRARDARAETDVEFGRAAVRRTRDDELTADVARRQLHVLRREQRVELADDRRDVVPRRQRDVTGDERRAVDERDVVRRAGVGVRSAEAAPGELRHGGRASDVDGEGAALRVRRIRQI